MVAKSWRDANTCATRCETTGWIVSALAPGHARVQAVIGAALPDPGLAVTAVAPDLIADAAAYAAVLGNGVRKRRRDRIEFRVGESTAYEWSVED